MARPPRTWLWADTHFYHYQIREYCGRPDDCDELMIRRAQHLVYPQDTLIHLGDVIFYKNDRLKEILDSIVALTKILVIGNHDKKSRTWYLRNGFNAVCDTMQIGPVVFSHRPIKRFPSMAKVNIHGHLHNTGHRPPEDWYQPIARHILVAIEEHDYNPVRLDHLMDKREAWMALNYQTTPEPKEQPDGACRTDPGSEEKPGEPERPDGDAGAVLREDVGAGQDPDGDGQGSGDSS